MKKLLLFSAGFSFCLLANAQTFWDTKLIYPNPADSPRIGTANDAPFDIYTHGTKRLSINSEGEIFFPGLAPTAEAGEQLLTIDNKGMLRQSGGGRVYNCKSLVIPWYLGGNTQSPYNDIGTCDNQDFILKANDRRLVFLKNDNPYVGVGPGNTAPYGTLDISDGDNGSLGVPDHTRIFGDNLGAIESTGAMNLMSTDGFAYGIGSYLGGWNTKFLINTAGDIGIGHNNIYPTALIDARSGTATMKIFSTTVNGSLGTPAKIWVMNALNSYSLSVDAAGIGHIENNVNGSSPFYLMNFKQGSGPNPVPQVWIGDKLITTGTHTDAKFAVYGKMVAQEIVVTLLNWNFPDYVFDKDYKLRSLKEVESYYTLNHHLPEVPSAEEVAENGMNVTEMNTILLKKIEELTLYAVDQQKQLEQLQRELSDLKSQVK